jgi:transposase
MSDKPKRKPGRPTKYRPEYCERVVELAEGGLGRLEISSELRIWPDTLLEWERQHPEFLQATTRARAISQAWWEAQGRLGIWSKDFNAAAYSLQVRNRFPRDWRDKQDHEVTGADGAPMEIAVTRKVIPAATNRIAALSGLNGHGNGNGR